MDVKMDIFPRYLSSCVNKLVYPGKTFENFKNEGLCYIFIMHLDRNNKIYYYKLDWTDQYLAHMMHVGKGSQTCNYFHPEKINWSNVHKKLERDTSQDNKKNSDVRIGFKNGDRYLVKADFTFGNRTVESGTAHFIQTLNVPLVLYVAKKPLPPSIGKAAFPCSKMYLYERKTLHANGAFRIRPGTNYILYSTQKNFFSLNIIRDTDAIQIPYTDPLEPPVKRDDIYDKPIKTPYIDDLQHDAASNNLPDSLELFFKTPRDDIYDKPLKTPYIDDLNESASNNPDLELLFKTVQPPKEDFVFLEPFPVEPIYMLQQATFPEPTLPEPMPQATTLPEPQATLPEPIPQETTLQHETTFPEPMPQETTFPEPPEPQLKKRKVFYSGESMKKPKMCGLKALYEPQQDTSNQDLTYDQVVNLEFAKYYQMLKNKQMDDPRLGCIAPDKTDVCYPLDLTTHFSEQLNGQTDEQLNDEQLNGQTDEQLNSQTDEQLNSQQQILNETDEQQILNELIDEIPTYLQSDFSDMVDDEKLNELMMEFCNSYF